MYKPLEISIRTLWTWEYTLCSDCGAEHGHYEVKYPRMKQGIVRVCKECLNQYYKKE